MSDNATYTLAEIVKRTGFDKRTTSYYVQKGLLPRVGRRGPKTRYPQAFLNRLLFIKLMREKQDRGEIKHLTLENMRDLLDRVRPETIADMVNGRESLHDVPSFAVAPAYAEVAGKADTVNAAPEPPPAQSFRDELSDVIEIMIDDPGEVSSPLDTEADAPEPSRDDLADFEAPEPRQGSPTDEEPVHRPFGREKAAQDDAPEAGGAGADEKNEANGSYGFAHVEQEDRLGWSLARLQKAVDKPHRNRGTTESWHRARITPELTISARSLSDDDAHLLDAVARMLKQLLWQAWED